MQKQKKKKKQKKFFKCIHKNKKNPLKQALK